MLVQCNDVEVMFDISGRSKFTAVVRVGFTLWSEVTLFLAASGERN